MSALELVTPPSVELVTRAEMKAQARIDTDADDALVDSLIKAARQWAEQYTRRALIAQTWRLWLDAMPEENVVALPRPPLAAVSKVAAFDDRDVETVFAAENYFVDHASEPGRLALRTGADWPVPGRSVNGFMIEYTAGYGEVADVVPEPIRLAVKQLAAHWYEHRGEAVMMSSQSTVNVPLIIQALLNPYRIHGIA